MSYRAKVIRLLRFVDIGRDKVFARFINIYNLVIITSTLLLVKGFEMRLVHIILAMSILLIVLMVSGWYWIRSGAYAVDVNVDNNANPFWITLNKRLDKIEEKLGIKK